jgi:methanogenic corrinoid protein MtbC1
MAETKLKNDHMMNGLIKAILEGDCALAISQVKQLCAGGIGGEYIVVHGVEAAMSALNDKCTLEQFNLLEIMLAGRAVTEIMKFLFPAGINTSSSKGKVVLATLEGDVHDLGKNILKMVLIANGYQVVDCGKDCSLQTLVDTVGKELPFAVGVSGLITPVMSQVKKIKNLLLSKSLGNIKVFAGGAALKQSSPDKLLVDFVAESAFDGLRYLEEINGARK